MTVSKVTSTLSPYTTDLQSPWKQRAQDFKALQTALQSGDLSGAQQAFATLQQDQQKAPQPTASTRSSGQSSQAAKDFQSLQTALSSGDLSGAQQAFATLQQDLQAAGQARHPHRYHGGSSTPATASGNPTLSAAAVPAATTTTLDLQA